jgi:selenium metabolism protein YedF
MKDDTKTVDARGLACPEPVIMTRKALQQADEVLTIVDNPTSQHNVTRMAEKAGYVVQVEQRGDGTYLHIAKGHAAQEPVPAQTAAPQQGLPTAGPLVLVVASEFMGRGEHAELGDVLIRSFFHTLGEIDPLPATIILFNSGVKLVVEGSPVVEDLQALCGRGVEVLVCGTCLGYYNLKDKVVVGQVSNMYSIAETMFRAGKVVHL